MKRALIGIAAVAFVAVLAAPVGAQYYGWPTAWNFTEGMEAAGVTDTRPCASGYERAAPGFCKRNFGAATVGLVMDACTPIQMPDPDARFIIIESLTTVRGKTTIPAGPIDASTFAYGNAACTGGYELVSRATGYSPATDQYWVGSDKNAVTVKAVADPNAIYVKFTSNSDVSSSSIKIVGYYD